MPFVILLFFSYLSYLLEIPNNFGEFYASAYSDEVELDKVDASSWFDVDITNKLVTIDNFTSVVRLITYNRKVSNTAATLHIS
jgi:hypothetical protein